MVTSTGIPVLDDMLRGGLPDKRAVLLVGGPGTGKTTLAMQYLQDGLEREEKCLFVSTEQTAAELRDSFAPYDFDLDTEHLSIESIHATPGQTIEDGDGQLTLSTLTDAGTNGDSADARLQFGQFGTAFTPDSIQDFLAAYAPCDRVVFDSVSGLEAMSSDNRVFRRSVLDFIRLFSDEFGATTVFTAEDDAEHRPDGTSGLLQFNTHGVIRLWREPVDGDYHRFVQVKKMRGVDHATKPFEIELNSEGVHVVPENRTPSASILEYDALSTGISGLDHLLGGGFVKGGTALLDHDGRANVNTLVTNMIIEAVRQNLAIVLLPPSTLEPEQLDRMIAERVGSVGELLDNDQLFVLDLSGAWDGYDYNVFTIREYERVVRQLFGGLNMLVSWKMKQIFKTMNERRLGRPALAVVYTEAMLQEFDPKEVRQMHQWAKKNLFVPDDTVLFVQNPGVMEQTLSEFFVLDAQQLLRTWMHETGLQYVKLEKAPMGDLGSSKLVEHVDYPPYVRVQRTASRTHRAIQSTDRSYPRPTTTGGNQ